jgi:RNA polymerase sigma-70 factor (ECF subfamily)
LTLTERDTLMLLNRMAAGDQAAAREFYRAYAPVVKSFLKGDGWEPSLVEDAVQRTMLEVWKHPTRYHPGGSAKFKTWLLGIANKRLIDLLRKRPKQQMVELDDEMIATEADEGYVRVHGAQLRSAVQQCMKKLKASHRQLLVLAHEHELPGREIAQVMAMPEGTVKSALHTPKGLVTKCLERLLGGATR